MKYVTFLFLSTACFLTGCHQPDPPLFQQLSAEETGIHFNNRIIENDSVNIVDFFYIYNGGGVGIGDLNNDQLPDIYLTGNQVSSRLYLNKGNFQFQDITDAAGVSTSEWARGIAMADVNNDGLLDIYVSVSGNHLDQPKSNKLFINQGNGRQGIPTFREQARDYGLADTAHSTQAAFFDYDKDGDLDVYLLTNGIENFSHNNLRPKKIAGEGISTDRLYRNEGPDAALGHPVFRNVSKEAGILIEGYGLGIGISDINRDGWPDVYCANDFVSNDLLWINNGDGTFSDSAAYYLRHTSYNGMGMDIADINNDGLVDIVEVDMLPEGNKRQKTMLSAMNFDRYQNHLQLNYLPQFVRNTLQLNNGQIPNPKNGFSAPMFGEIGQLSGIHATDWSWSALLADYDNDGYRDLFITNGYPKDIIDLDYITYRSSQIMFGTLKSQQEKLRKLAGELPTIKVHNYLYRNNGDLTFSDKSQDWGFGQLTDSNGAAFADLDNDGDLDLVVNNINDLAGVYRNDARKADAKGLVQGNHYLRIKLEGKPGNDQAIGAKVELRYQGQFQFHDHFTARGFQSSVENVIHFGLGSHASVDSLSVTWPDGKQQVLRQVKADQVLRLRYQDAVPASAPPPTPAPLFTEVASRYGIDYQHEENDYIDFKVQPLLPHMYSRNGPGLAVGDVDGNGLDDFFVGGASGKSGRIYYQFYTAGQEPAFRGVDLDKAVKAEEDMGALFFDADGDGDLDLYVVSGGNEFAVGSVSYQDRFYRNEGKGRNGLPRLVKDANALPEAKASGSCVTAADFDRDGDLDLFIGGRVVPNAYPMPAQSYLLRNNGGHFEDVTATVAKSLQNIGLVCTALWTDFDGDGWSDLIVSGEWMPITFFRNNQGKLENVTDQTGLKHTAGWWNSLTAGDFDNDGDTDYVLGNLGLNNRFHASPEQPVQVFAHDFDKNGSVDAILTYYLPGVDGKKRAFPAPARDAVTDQMVGLRKKFPTYAVYAEAQVPAFFPAQELAEAYVATGEYFTSVYLENTGARQKGSLPQFKLRPLPMQAQIAPVFGLAAVDYDQDGYLDLISVGNLYATEVQNGPYDASLGLVMRGDGQGNFRPVSPVRSGFVIDGDAKGLAQIRVGNDCLLWLVTQNNGAMRAYQQTSEPVGALLTLQPADAYAVVTLASGKKVRQEFYYGSTYLSQSSRTWRWPVQATEAVMHTFDGKTRKIQRPELATAGR